MEDIYRETVTAIENGANFRIDFQSRSLKVNGRHMIRNGRYDGAPWLPEYGCGDFFTDVEFYILCRIIGGFTWNPETMGKWFWQSEKDKDLVILRKWVEPGSNQLLTNSQ